LMNFFFWIIDWFVMVDFLFDTPYYLVEIPYCYFPLKDCQPVPKEFSQV
jgi:hypothetical protein